MTWSGTWSFMGDGWCGHGSAEWWVTCVTGHKMWAIVSCGPFGSLSDYYPENFLLGECVCLFLRRVTQKVVKFGSILHNFRLWPQYLRKESRYPKSERHVIENDSSRVRRKKSGELWSTIQKVEHVSLDQPSRLFSGDYISALRGAGPSNILYFLYIDQSLKRTS